MENNTFDPYGITEGKIDDPNKKSIVGLLSELHDLNSKIMQIESEIKDFKLKERDLKDILSSKKTEIESIKGK
jgi:predicted  nucleic acid-binding Zn-ribbon protein